MTNSPWNVLGSSRPESVEQIEGVEARVSRERESKRDGVAPSRIEREHGQRRVLLSFSFSIGH